MEISHLLLSLESIINNFWCTFSSSSYTAIDVFQNLKSFLYFQKQNSGRFSFFVFLLFLGRVLFNFWLFWLWQSSYSHKIVKQNFIAINLVKRNIPLTVPSFQKWRQERSQQSFPKVLPPHPALGQGGERAV